MIGTTLGATARLQISMHGNYLESELFINVHGAIFMTILSIRLG